MVWRLGRPLPGSIEEAARKIELLMDIEEAEKRRGWLRGPSVRNKTRGGDSLELETSFSSARSDLWPAGSENVSPSEWWQNFAEAVGPSLPLKGDAGEHEREKDEKCERQYDKDSETCRELESASARARCWASASKRLGACLSGSFLPDLETERHWEPPTPTEVPQVKRPTVRTPPTPGGGGAFLPIWRMKPRDPRLF